MLYVLIENNELRGVLDYKPNIGDDEIQVIEYDGIVPKDNIRFFEGEIVDKESLMFVNGKYIKRDYKLEKQLNTNQAARKFLNDTDWLVLRHQDQVALGLATSLTSEEYIELLNKRQIERAKVIDYKE